MKELETLERPFLSHLPLKPRPKVVSLFGRGDQDERWAANGVRETWVAWRAQSTKRSAKDRSLQSWRRMMDGAWSSLDKE